jgi:cytochrome c-type biogenesis protein CcmF
MVPVLFLMVFGAYARWKSDSLPTLAKKLRLVALVSVVLGCAATLLAGAWSTWVALGLTLVFWIVLASLLQIYRQLRDTVNRKSTPLSFWGMHLAHIGIAVCVAGITVVRGYESEKDVRMTVGDTVSVGGYTLRLTGIKEALGPNYNAVVGELVLSRDERVLKTLRPEKRTYFSSTMPMTEAAIDRGLARDVYVSLGEQLEGGAQPAWAVRVYYKPLVNWIWGGCVLMALGGAMAALDRRYRKRLAPRGEGVAAKDAVA